MSHTLSQLANHTISSYLETLGSFLLTLEALIDAITTLMYSDDNSFGPVEHALVLYLIASANNAKHTIALFKQANVFLGELTDDQRQTLGECMERMLQLEQDLASPLEEMELLEW